MSFISPDSMASYMVRPHEQHRRFGCRDTYVLPATELIVSYTVDTAHVVPGAINLPRFIDALSRTLSAYPLHAGRLRRPTVPGGPWAIHFEDIGVPVTVVDSDATRVVESAGVFQRPLKLARMVNIPEILQADSQEPLMRVTITRFVALGYTSIGVSMWHPLGDGFTTLRFLRMLSQCYQDLDPADPVPGFGEFVPKASAYRTDASTKAAWEKRIFPFGALSAHEPCKKTVQPRRIDFRLSRQQLEQLRRGVASLAPQEQYQELHLSRQDCMAALLAICMSKADFESPPVNVVHTMFNYRRVHPSLSNTAGNALLWATADSAITPAPQAVYDMAMSIRQSLLRAQNPEFVAAYATTLGDKYRAVADSGMMLDGSPPVGHMVVNSTFRFDWTSAHFGFPGRTQFFHTSPPASRYVKITRPNPTLLPDGSWRSNAGDAEIILYLPPLAESRFEAILTQEVRALGVTGDIDWLHEEC